VSRAKPLRLGVIADTHGLYDAAVERHFGGVREILHAGDIGDPSVIARLERIAPVVAISGNVDGYEKSGRDRRTVITRGGIAIGLCHVLYEGGKLTEDAKRWLDRERPDVCIFGHSHRPTIDHYNRTLLFNPGSAGPKRFSLPRSIGLLTIKAGQATPELIRLPRRALSKKRLTKGAAR